MQRKDMLYFAGMVLVAALLAANLFKPTALHAYDLSLDQESVAVDVSSTNDAAKS